MLSIKQFIQFNTLWSFLMVRIINDNGIVQLKEEIQYLKSD